MEDRVVMAKRDVGTCMEAKDCSCSEVSAGFAWSSM